MPHFTTTDGTRLAYEDYEIGGGTGEPVVFAASWALNADMWEYQIPYLVERGYRCIALDRRGHGRSERPSTGYDLDTTADDLGALLEHLDLTGVTLVGHSFGGAEVARYLARHGERRVARVAFVSAVVPLVKQTDDNPEGLAPRPRSIEATIAQFRTDRPKWFARQAQVWYATHLGNEVSPALIDWTIGQCLSASPWATTQLFRSMFHADHRAGLAEITVPTLVVHGAADTSAPVALTGRQTAALVPGCRYVEYPTGGHGLHVTHAEQLNTDLLELLKG